MRCSQRHDYRTRSDAGDISSWIVASPEFSFGRASRWLLSPFSHRALSLRCSWSVDSDSGLEHSFSTLPVPIFSPCSPHSLAATFSPAFGWQCGHSPWERSVAWLCGLCSDDCMTTPPTNRCSQRRGAPLVPLRGSHLLTRRG